MGRRQEDLAVVNQNRPMRETGRRPTNADVCFVVTCMLWNVDKSAARVSDSVMHMAKAGGRLGCLLTEICCL